MKRLGTGDRYCATSDGVQQVAWANQEPPSIYGGECQAMNRQITAHTVLMIAYSLYLCALEADRGVICHVEEIR